MRKDSVDIFADQAARIPLLTTAEEIHLGRIVQQMMAVLIEKPLGPYTKAEQRVIYRGKRAKDRFVNANLRLVVTLARKFQRVMASTLDLTAEDLLQEGMFGLMRAVEKYDPERGYKFSTYAYWWIRQSMSRAIHVYGRAIRLPLNVAERMSTLNRKRHELNLLLNRQPTIQELADAMDWQPEFLEHVLLMGNRLTSLDQQMTIDGSSLVEIITDGETSDDHLLKVFDDMNRDKLMELIGMLTDKEQTALIVRYGLQGEPATLREVGEVLGISRERARQILERAVRRLRHLVIREPFLSAAA